MIRTHRSITARTLFGLALVVTLCSVSVLPSCQKKQTNDPRPDPCKSSIDANVFANVLKLGAFSSEYVSIGTLNVKSHKTDIEATFTFSGDYGDLDDDYEFMWINVLVEQSDMTGPVTSNDFFTFLPWIDPNPDSDTDGSGFPDSDLEVFYWDVIDQFLDNEEIHIEGSFSYFFDAPESPISSTVMKFKTFLVSVEESNHNTVCVLYGFEWTYTQSSDCVSSVAFIPIDADLVQEAMDNGNATSSSDPENGGYFNEAYSANICEIQQFMFIAPKGGDVAMAFMGPTMEFAGTSVTDGYDQDLDGLAGEFLVGAPGSDAAGQWNSGRVVVVSATSGDTLDEFTGLGPADAFGTSVAVVGDTNGDGHADILIGAPQADLAGTMTGPGYAQLRSGATGGVLGTWIGGVMGQQFGLSVGGVGDVDADGAPDFMIGGPALGSMNAGQAVLISGATGGVLRTITGGSGDAFGFRVGSAGDINADGTPDYFITAPQLQSTGPGYVRVYSGTTGALLNELRGELAAERFGFSCVNLGDVTGDGRPELAVGAPRWSGIHASAGALRVFSHFTQTASTSPGTASVSTSPPGVGPALVLVGGALAGGAEVFMVPSIAWSVFGSKAYDCLGASVAPIGDFDGDGQGDVIVGAPQADLFDHVVGPGYVRILTHSGSLIATVKGDLSYDMFGLAVGALPDLDFDGRAEFVAGAPLADSPSFNSGTAQVISDPAPPSVWTDQRSTLAGMLGNPVLVGAGTLLAGSSNAITLSNAAPLAVGVLFMALSSTPVPFKGGILLPFPPAVTLFLPTSGAGTILLTLVLPPGVPAGTTLWLQWAIQDAGAPLGIALSNAIKGIAP